MAYEEGIDDPCNAVKELHSLSWLLHRKEAPLACADPSNSIPTMLAADMPSTGIF